MEFLDHRGPSGAVLPREQAMQTTADRSFEELPREAGRYSHVLEVRFVNRRWVLVELAGKVHSETIHFQTENIACKYLYQRIKT